jgi:hypothetical protein
MAKGTGPHTPNPECKDCQYKDSACISCYMAAGGYND